MNKITFILISSLFLHFIVARNEDEIRRRNLSTFGSLANIPITHKKCQWIDLDSCRLSCANTTIEILNRALEYYINSYEQVVICYIQYAKVRLTEITFPDNTISPEWYNADDIRLKELEIDLIDVEVIEENSFFTDRFKALEILTLKNMSLNVLSKDTFQGLSKLITLIMVDIPFDIIEENCLAPLKSLKYISMDKIGNSSISLYNLTGSVKLDNLRELKITESLVMNIESDAFNGLTALTDLVLNECENDEIQGGAFQGIEGPLLKIDIQKNNLRSLDYDTVSHLAEVQYLQVYLGDNLWSCSAMDSEAVNLIQLNQDVFIGWSCSTDENVSSTEDDSTVTDEQGSSTTDKTPGGHSTINLSCDFVVLFALISGLII